MMKKFKFFWLFFLLLSFVWGEKIGMDIKKHVLDNGLTVYIKEIHKTPVVTIDIWVRTGVINETYNINGVSHFLEHMIFKGTEKLKPGEADRIIDSLGGVNNAATSFDFTHFYVKIGKNNWKKGFEVLAELLMHAKIDPEEFKREKIVVQEEYRRKQDNPANFIQTIAFHKSFKNKYPYAWEILGEPEVFAKLSRDEMYNYYKKYYRPNNMAVFIFGDIEEKDVLKTVKKIMGDFSGKAPTYTKKQRKIEYNKGLYEYYFKDMKDAYMVLTFPAPSVFDEDFPAMDVLTTLLGEGRSSKLNQIIKEKMQLAYSISAGYSTLYAPGVFEIYASFNPEYKDELREEVLKIVKDIQSGNISNEEIEKSKNMIITSLEYMEDSTSSQTSYYGYYYALTGDINIAQKYPELIKKVSKTDVIKVAKKYLDINTVNTFFVFSKEYESKFKPKIEVVDEYKNVRKYSVDNVPFIVKNVPDSKILAINIFFPFGTNVEPDDKKGLLTLLGNLITRGTKTRNSQEIAEEIESLGASFSFKPGYDLSVIKLSCLKKDFYKFQKIVWDILKNATFPEEEFKKQKNLLLKSIELKENDRFQYAEEKALKLLFKGTYYEYPDMGTKKTVKNITRDDVVKFYKKYFGYNNMTFVIVGNVDEKFLKDMSEKIAFLRKGEKPKIPEFKYVLPQKKRFEIIKKDIEQSNIIVAYPTYPITNRKKMASFRVLCNILGGGMSSLFFRELRDINSLAYAVGAIPYNKKYMGAFIVYIGTQNKRAQESIDGINKIIQRIKEKGITKKQLEKSINNLIGVFELAHETSSNQAYYLGLYEMYGLGYKYDFILPDDLKKVTLNDVQEVAKEIFSRKPVTVIIGNPKLKE